MFIAGSGIAGDPGGKTHTYSNIDESLFAELYFGAATDIAVGAALDGAIDSASEIRDLNLSSLNVINGVGSAEWDGQSTVTTVFGPQLADIRFIMTVSDFFGNRPTAVDAPSISGIPSTGTFARVDVLQLASLKPSNGDFNVNCNSRLAMPTPPQCLATLNTYFNQLSTSCTGCVRTSFIGGFYEELASVPERGSLACLGWDL